LREFAFFRDFRRIACNAPGRLADSFLCNGGRDNDVRDRTLRPSSEAALWLLTRKD